MVRNNRGPFYGTVQIIRFNWSQYLTGLLVVMVVVLLMVFAPLPSWCKVLLGLGAAGALYFMVSSVVASWLIYDRSVFRRWVWIKKFLMNEPVKWMLLHTGLDDTSEWLRGAYPNAKGVVLDIFDADYMTEASILRARRFGSAPPCAAADWDNFPIGSGSIDCVFMITAVHEFRENNSRDEVFREAVRTLKPGGQLLLVEHLRDAANFAVFGPGFMHFWPRVVWLETACGAGLHLERERKITPWIHAFVFSKPELDELKK